MYAHFNNTQASYIRRGKSGLNLKANLVSRSVKTSRELFPRSTHSLPSYRGIGSVGVVGASNSGKNYVIQYLFPLPLIKR